MNIDDCSSPETICLQCGDKGFTNAFVYCVKCLQFAVHRYCLSVLPKSGDEFVRWVCDDCELAVIERRPKGLKKKLSIDDMTLADRINRGTRKNYEPQTSDSPAPVPTDIIANSTEVLSMKSALHEKDAINTRPATTRRSTLLTYKAEIVALKEKVSTMEQDKLLQTDELLKMKSLSTKKSNMIKRAQRALAEEITAKDELTREIERLKEEHAEALAVARLEGAKAFKASLAFQECVVARALDVYKHGFNVCLAQAKHARAFRNGFDASLLDPCKDEKLRVRTKVEEEPQIEDEFAQLVD